MTLTKKLMLLVNFIKNFKAMRNKCLIDGSMGVEFAQQFGWKYLRCPECGLQWTSNVPTREELARLYSPVSGYQRHHARQPIDRTNPHYRMLIDLVCSTRPAPARVLDVGCSAGDVAVPLIERGYKVDGIEPNDTTARVASARGVKIIGSDISSISADHGYDIIIASEVIEHVLDPETLVHALSSHLSPSGIMVISTPNSGSWMARGQAWLMPKLDLPVPYLIAPYHLTYFNADNLNALLTHHTLQVNRIRYRSSPSLKYELGNTHLWGAFRRSPSLKSASRMLLGFSLLSLLWLADGHASFTGLPGSQMYVVIEREGC